jgi:hypothetical protein
MAVPVLPVTPGEMLDPAADHSANLVTRVRKPGAFLGGEPAAPVGALQSGQDLGDRALGDIQIVGECCMVDCSKPSAMFDRIDSLASAI